MRIAFAALLAFTVAACGSGTAPTPASNETANQVTTAQESGARIAALSDVQRNATFYRAIHDAGKDCQQVTSSAAAGSYHNLPVWNATCRGGGHWTLVIGNDDIVQILNANEARLVTDQSQATTNGASGR